MSMGSCIFITLEAVVFEINGIEWLWNIFWNLYIMSCSFQKEKKIFWIPSIRRTVHVRHTKAVIVKNILVLVIVAQFLFCCWAEFLASKQWFSKFFFFFLVFFYFLKTESIYFSGFLSSRITILQYPSCLLVNCLCHMISCQTKFGY